MPRSVTVRDAAELYDRLLFFGAATRELRGMADVDIRTPDGERHAAQVLLLQAPDRFRVETLGMFGPPLMTMTSDGEQFAVVIPGRAQYYRGAATPENLSRFVPFPFAGDQLVGTLLGRLPLLKHVRKEVQTDRLGHAVLTLTTADALTQSITFDSELRPIRADYFRDGAAWLTISYQRFGTPPAIAPRSVDVELPQEDLVVSIRWNDMEFNPGIEPKMFNLEFPAGADVRELP